MGTVLKVSHFEEILKWLVIEQRYMKQSKIKKKKCRNNKKNVDKFKKYNYNIIYMLSRVDERFGS